ncbi:MAG: HNH endonuclease [Lachnospiraceae bacterium]|nr:HNH endonuclease [Lachnospiraceae bacterium]
MSNDKKLHESIQEAIILGWFKSFHDKNISKADQQRLRNIYANSSDPTMTTKNLFINFGFNDISDPDAMRLSELINAFLKKSPYRKNIPYLTKKELFISQNHRCAICNSEIDIHAHVDHIVPFLYVGDELTNNYQLLCSNCNLRKNASIDFQIRFLLKTL